MFIKELNGKFHIADNKKPLKYEKNSKKVCVFNPQKEHFIEAGYKELIKTEKPDTKPEQYIETTYELKDDKYYEIHTIVDIKEVIE